MMNLLTHAREGNRVFSITLPSGERVLFKLLSWKDFNVYWEVSQKGTVPQDIVEKSVFEQCCLDPVILQKVPDMRAGIVSTVVSLIMTMSGPNAPESFNSDMDVARSLVDTLNSQIVMVICRAFPAYKPEDISSMAWSEVLIRLAQAERILMHKNPPELSEPIRLLNQEEVKSQPDPGQIDVDQLIRDGKRDAAELGRPEHSGLTEADIEMGREVQIRQKRRQMAKRYMDR